MRIISPFKICKMSIVNIAAISSFVTRLLKYLASVRILNFRPDFDSISIQTKISSLREISLFIAVIILFGTCSSKGFDETMVHLSERFSLSFGDASFFGVVRMDTLNRREPLIIRFPSFFVLRIQIAGDFFRFSIANLADKVNTTSWLYDAAFSVTPNDVFV